MAVLLQLETEGRYEEKSVAAFVKNSHNFARLGLGSKEIQLSVMLVCHGSHSQVTHEASPPLA